MSKCIEHCLFLLGFIPLPPCPLPSLPTLFPLSLLPSPLPYYYYCYAYCCFFDFCCCCYCCCCYILFQLLNSFYLTPCALHFSNSPPKEGESERLPGTSRHLGMNHNSGDQNFAGVLFLNGARGTDLEPST